jgi:hypothetical protein
MADEKDNKKLDELSRQSSFAVFGVDEALDDQSKAIRDIVKQTMVQTSEKYGNRANGKVVNYFNELNFSNAFSELIRDPEKRNKGNANQSNINPTKDFKKYMSEQDFGSISGILMQESGRIIGYSNYRAIYNHIPEAAQALDIFKDNILSPDDFTKLIFNVNYDNNIDEELKNQIEGQFQDIIRKYGFEELAEEIIEGSLLYGDQYVAVLSLEDELELMLTDPISKGQVINEKNIAMFDLDSIDIELNMSDIDVDNSGFFHETFSELMELNEDDKFTEDDARRLVADLVNNNVQIGSKKELILERISAEHSKELDLRSFDLPTNKKKRGKKEDTKPMYINGSSLRVLDPSKVVELKIDNVVYGYYYIENANIGNIPNAGYLGSSTGREVLNPVNMGSNIITTNNSKFAQSFDKVSATGLSDQKVDLISRIFLDTLSKKINKDFIRHNKEFKEFIYNLVKQDYILKKEIRITYFAPNEVVAFKVPALYRKITFFAKLYLSMLTNMLLIKMGRAHDKRVFYIDVGVDANYEQAISRVIQDIKTKEFKMDTIGDINTVLNLNPGRFDDYYIPTVNGERAIEIDTLAGMDIDMNNDFIEFLKDSMMAGMGVPRTLIDANKELDFARTLSAQNGNFVRSVIKYQKRLTDPFNKLFRVLYENEYKFYNDGKSEIPNIVNFNDIKVSFPSPATLNMSNLTDQIQAVDGNAEFIANTLVAQDPTGANDQLRSKLKSEVIKDLLPAIDWTKYEDLLSKVEIESVKDDVKVEKEDELGLY